MAERYLINIAIGPVQEFIATARRSRDLWFGSWLLSELSKAAAKKIYDQPGASLIFPAIEPTDQDKLKLEPASDFNVVNKLTAVIETDQLLEGTNAKEKVAKFAGRILGAAQERLTRLSNEAFKKDKDSQDDFKHFFDRERAEKQIEDLLEFYFVAVPLQDYPKDRQQAEALLVARKNTRAFSSASSWANEPGIEKSSLDGLRESVIKQSAYKEDGLNIERRRILFGTRPGEKLCGVGLLKRLGNREGEEGFYSTSHIAALPLLTNLKDQDQYREKIKAYFGELEKLSIEQGAWSQVSSSSESKTHKTIRKVFQRNNKPCDGRLLFEDRLAEYFGKDRKDDLRKAQKALRAFLKDVFGNRKPNPYYALLLADGDGMGDAIKHLNTPEDHQRLSLKLSAFAGSVRGIVEKDHHGSLIYAGGDDVLAFVPLHTAVQCAQTLAKSFEKALENKGGKSPTLTIGVAITHHLDPLSDALELAREAEKEAKRLPGKNALCIKLSKRSGETTTVVDHWDKLDKRLEFFTCLFVADKLPDGVAYELRKLAEQLKLQRDAIPYELKGVLKRKRAGHGKEELAEPIRQRLSDVLDEITLPFHDSSPLECLADELIVARALAVAQEQAYATLEAAQKGANKKLAEFLPNASKNNGGEG
jgi:CRISPR-associated protein Cmr2